MSDATAVAVEMGDPTQLELLLAAAQTKMEAKEECWQLLTVDEATYHSWKSLAHSQSLLSDSLVAKFLLQHYEKTSCMTLTECFKCHGPLSQYCVRCNVYMGQPVHSTDPSVTSDGDPGDHPAAPAPASADSETGSPDASGDLYRAPGKSTVLDVPEIPQEDPSQNTVSFQASETHRDTALANEDEPRIDNTESEGPQAREKGVGDTVLDGFDTAKEAADPAVTAQDNGSGRISSTLENGRISSLPDTGGRAKTTPLPPNRTVSTRSRSKASNGLDDLAGRVIIITDRRTAAEDRSQARSLLSQAPAKRKAESPPATATTRNDLSNKVRVVVDAEDSRQEEEEAGDTTTTTGVSLSKEGDDGKTEGGDWRRNGSKGDKAARKRTYPCEMCGQELRSRYELDGHLKVHRGERPFACQHCPAAYTRSYHLKAHMRKHDEVKPHACPHCPKAFTRLGDLKAHEVTHSAQRPFVCETCGFATKTLNNLKVHRRVHDSGRSKDHVCPHCGVGFRWKSNFRDHLKMHEDDRAFACPHCPMTYVQSGSLKRHMDRKHVANRPRPFVCEICGAARYERTQFEKHMMIHTGIKPHQCGICGAAFIQANALKGHMKIHTDTLGKTNWCSLCGAAFKRFASVKTHIKKVHKDVSMFSIETVEIHVPVRNSPSQGQELCQ